MSSPSSKASSASAVVASDAKASADLNGAAGDAELIQRDDPDDERQELLEEVEELKENQLYVDFLEGVCKDGKVEEDEEEDADFKLEEEKKVEEKGEDVKDLDVSSTDSSDDDDEEEDDEEAGASSSLVDSKGRPQFVEIPRDMAVEANKRFPFLWRTEYQLRSANSASYRSEEDPDYDPEADGAKEEDRAEEAEDDVEEEEIDESIKKLEEGQVDEIMMAELVDDMKELELESKAAAEGAVEGQQQEEEEMMEEKHVSLVDAITSFDEETYRSEDDPDYDPPSAKMEEDLTSSSTSEDGEGETDGEGEAEDEPRKKKGGAELGAEDARAAAEALKEVEERMEEQ